MFVSIWKNVVRALWREGFYEICNVVLRRFCSLWKSSEIILACQMLYVEWLVKAVDSDLVQDALRKSVRHEINCPFARLNTSMCGSSKEGTEKDEICFIAFVCRSLQGATCGYRLCLRRSQQLNCNVQSPFARSPWLKYATRLHLCGIPSLCSLSCGCSCGWHSPSAPRCVRSSPSYVRLPTSIPTLQPFFSAVSAPFFFLPLSAFLFLRSLLRRLSIDALHTSA